MGHLRGGHGIVRAWRSWRAVGVWWVRQAMVSTLTARSVPVICAWIAFCGVVQGAAHAATPLNPIEDALAAYAEARQASAAGQWDRAEILLERVLMLMPEHAEARIDFAVLMARRGQPETARQLLRGLIDDPRTPADYRQRLLAMVSALPREQPSPRPEGGLKAATFGRPSANGSPPRAVWRGEASWLVSTNPLARTSASELLLTVGGGTVALPLATRPEAGHVTGLALSRATATGGVDVSFQALAQPAEGLEASAHRLSLWRSLLTHESWPMLPAGAELQGAVQTQQGFDGLRRHTAGLMLRKAAYRLSLLHYAEPGQEEAGALLRYEHRWATPRGSWPTVGAVMLERSASQRREQGYWRLGVVTESTVSASGKLQLQLTAQQDTAPYSVLLENNAKRRLFTGYVGFEQQWNLGDRTALVGRLFAGRRLSNLALFDFQDAGAQLAWVQLWR
jgi:hypothetical protein